MIVISVLREGRLEKDQRGIFDLGGNIRMLTSPKIKPGEVDKFVNQEEEIGVRRKE